MTTHAVLVESKIAAKNIESLNRSALGSADLDNGFLVSLPTQNTAADASMGEVWDAAQPATATLAALWMVGEPEVNTTVSGTKKYKGLNPDPQDFYVPSGDVFSVFKPQIGDVIVLTGDGIATGSGAKSAYAVAVNGAYQLTWAAAAISGMTFKYIGETYISKASGLPGETQRVTAYKLECIAIA